MKDTFVAQHGGDHYQAEYQHWDWASDIGMLYLTGTATKYLSRWRKKNGIDDLIKSRTYLEKMIACWDQTIYVDTIDPPANVDELTEKFILLNNLGEVEADICRLLSNLYIDEECSRPKKALEWLNQLISSAQADAGKPR
jgi:hypothetical protein